MELHLQELQEVMRDPIPTKILKEIGAKERKETKERARKEMEKAESPCLLDVRSSLGTAESPFV